MPRNAEPSMQNCLKELRANHEGMTQQSLAEQVGVTRQTIVALEGGAYTPSLALALRIARVFDKHVEEMYWLEE